MNEILLGIFKKDTSEHCSVTHNQLKLAKSLTELIDSLEGKSFKESILKIYLIKSLIYTENYYNIGGLIRFNHKKIIIQINGYKEETIIVDPNSKLDLMGAFNGSMSVLHYSSFHNQREVTLSLILMKSSNEISISIKGMYFCVISRCN